VQELVAGDGFYWGGLSLRFMWPKIWARDSWILSRSVAEEFVEGEVFH